MSFRFKEGKFILGLPLSYKLYEYWQLCMHSLIAMALLPSPSETAWRNWLTPLTTSPDIFYSISLLLTLLDIYHYGMHNKEGFWNLRTRTLMRFAYLKLQNEMPQIREFWRIFIFIWISACYAFSVSSVQEMGAKTPGPRGRKLRVDAIRS